MNVHLLSDRSAGDSIVVPRAARVSVVIPAFNAEAFIFQALESVRQQTALPYEVIVVDDGSTDGTRSIVEQFDGFATYVYQQNAGVAAARNRGLELANGDYIAFLDADDYWHPRKLELQLQVFRERPELGMVGTAVFDWPVTDSTPAVEVDGAKLVEVVSWADLVVKNYFTTSSIVAQTSIVRAAGPFDTALQGPEDHDLWLRIAELSTVANLSTRLTGYRTVVGSLSKQASQMQMGMQSILRKLEHRHRWQGRRMLLRKAWSYCNCSCAYMHNQSGSPKTALRLIVRSLVGYPFPFRSSEVDTPFVRLRILASVCLSKFDH